ncbi:MAG TPA: hypothetical protein DG048_21510 [Pseudoalteromonas sp.]|nr:hypothetical protein [Pseudoalteromonas sp.]|tara:strand:+ start:1122 stop:1484 length:363 start_codon:yes stop_codon:yes gene_type:complete
MIEWQCLNWYQKAAFWLFIGIAGWFLPEIALLFHFGGVEVVFACLAAYTTSIVGQIKVYISEFKKTLSLAYFFYQTSPSTKPKVFFVQAVFCSTAFVLTGSLAFSAFFFALGFVLNGFLT